MSARSASAPRTYCVHAACLRGVDAVPVTVEVSLSGSIPGITFVGMADSCVQEASTRIRCAIRSGGYDMPRGAIVVNLAPGDIRKQGTSFDLPVIVAILAITGQMPRDGIDDCLLTGELALDGGVRPSRGAVAYALLARELGLTYVNGPDEAPIPLDGVRQGCIDHVRALVRGVPEAVRPLRAHAVGRPAARKLDYSDVVGQEIAKRGLAIAATGSLGLIMVGSPGAGKTMLARRFTTILPSIDGDALQEALCVHSVSGEDVSGLLAGERPFRAPHHSISCAGLVGGGRPVHPGEISLAHGGVLFLDELAEFPGNVLQSLRQPIERGYVRLVRSEGSFTFPSRFQLLAASNPCPCGYLGDAEIECACPPGHVLRYRSKLGGPLADRIDIMLDIARPDPALIVDGARGATSGELAAAVRAGRSFASWRESKRSDSAPGPDGNPTERPVDVEGAVAAFALDDAGKRSLLGVARAAHLTGRGITRVCRIARTIADMAESEVVGADHIMEAAMYQGRRFDER